MSNQTSSASNNNNNNNTTAMSNNNSLTIIHNSAMNYMVDNGVSNYSQAVLDSYEDTCANQGIELTDDLENQILDMVQQGNTRGDGNLSKNVITETEDSSVEIPTTNTNNNSSSMLQSNTSAFNSAFNAEYSEVLPLVSFGDADKLINFNGEGQSFAEVLASIMYTTQALQTPLAGETEEDLAEVNASIERRNTRALSNRDEFLNLFGSKLGFIVKHTMKYGAKGDYAKASHSVKKHFESLFTMAELPLVEEGEIRYTGLEFDAYAPSMFITNTGALWLAILAKATFNLTVEERAQLLGLLFHDVSNVVGTVVTRGSISIDVANATVSTGSRVLRANKASCFGFCGDFIVVDGCHAIFLFGLQALGGTAKQLETAINLAVKLFQPEHNYGHRPDHNDMAHYVRTNLVYTNAVKTAYRDFPSIEIIGGKQNPEFLGWVLGRGVIATSDKTNIKFVTINAGAEAVGVGYNRTETGDLDQMFTANDANKPTKLFNRPAANNYDCADLPDRVASNFGFALSNGEVARTKGKMMNVAFTNSILTFGSGVGIINQGSSFTFSIDKKEKESLNVSLFGHGYLNNPNAKKAVIAKIETAIKAIEGDVFAAGEVMLSIQENGMNFDLVRNGEKAADVVIKGGFVRNNTLDENAIDIVIEVALQGDTSFVKTRRFATKFTTVPYAAEFVGHNKEWDIILNNECTKGHGALLEMFANATGERFLNNSTQEFTTPDGDSFNVMTDENPFYQWRDANIQQDVKLRMTIAKSVWENQARFCSNTVEVISETVDSDGNLCVLVEETCDVIYGQLVFDVEISSPLESVSKSNLTLESASAIYLQSARLGNILFNECIKKAETFGALASRYAAADVEDMTVIDLEDDASFNFFVETFPILSNKDGSLLKQRQIMALAATKFPAGVEFLVGSTTFPVNFSVVATFGQFNAVNGSAARETSDVMNFLLDILFNGAEGRAKLVAPAKRAVAKILNTAVDSKKVLKKPTRAGNLVYGKVRTSFHPMLHTTDNIPTVVMNANCPMVSMLGIPTDGRLVDYYVGFARTPMPFLGGARIKLTTDASICDVAHVLVDPYVWHQLNEGDSDGDGIAMLNLSKLDFTAEEVRELNASIMGIAGYEHLYGDAVPFADFVSEEDKAGKKSFRGAMTLISTQVKNPDTGEKVVITAQFAGEFAARVANHYKTAVGTSYGICSALVFKAADWAADTEEDVSEVVTATLIAWRAMYEGLGLSGYSAKAARVFNIINLATMDLDGHKVLTAESANGEVACIWDADFKTQHPDAVEMAGSEAVRLEFPEFSHVSADVFDHIIEARCHTKVATRLEGFGKALTKYHYSIPNLIEGATKYGTLRRISQGDDRVSEQLGLVEEAQLAQAGEQVAIALTRRFDKKYDVMSDAFTNDALFTLTSKVCEFHRDLLITKGKAEDAANH